MQSLNDAYFFIPDASPSSFYRFVFPLRYLRKKGYYPRLAAVIQTHYFKKGKAFFFQRVADRSLFDLSLAIRNQPRAMIFDLDTYIEPPPYHPNFNFYASMRPYLEMVIQSSTMVTVPTQRLKDELKGLNENIFVLPNKFSSDVLERLEGETKNKLKEEAGLPLNSVVVGWGGTPFSLHELNFLGKVLNRLFEKINHLYFAIWGSETNSLQLPKERVVKFDFLPLSSYFVSLGIVDIGLIPAENTLFNSCKSGRMSYEYGLVGASVIAQNIEPYRRLVESGAPINLVNSEEEWEEKLVELIKDDDRRTDEGLKMKKWVKENCFFQDEEKEWQKFLTKLNEVLE